jgi:hypothetical protein
MFHIVEFMKLLREREVLDEFIDGCENFLSAMKMPTKTLLKIRKTITEMDFIETDGSTGIEFMVVALDMILYSRNVDFDGINDPTLEFYETNDWMVITEKFAGREKVRLRAIAQKLGLMGGAKRAKN